MYPLKQSTALDVAFFAHDAAGDGVTGKVDGDWTKRISKNGSSTWAAMTVTVTEGENGWYHLTLSSSHTDTLGILSISLSATGVKRVNLQYRVSARLVDDLATSAALATVQSDTDDIQSRLPAALSSGRMVSVAEVVSDKTGYALTSGEEDAIVNKVWDELLAEARAGASYGQKLKDLIVSSGRVDVGLWVGAAPNALIAGRVDANAQVVGDKTGYAVGAGGIGATSFAAGAIDAAAIAADAIGSAELAPSAAQEIADEILNRNLQGGGSGGRTVRDSLRVLRNKVADVAGAVTVYQEDDVTPAWTATSTRTAGADPITAIDPA